MQTQQRRKRKIEFDMTQFGADDREAMSKMYDQTLKDFEMGSIVPGKVLEVRESEVLVDIGYKSEGVIPAVEFQDLSAVKAGDTLDVLLEGLDDDEGLVVLSKEKAEHKIRWEQVVKTCAEGSVVEGKIVSRVRGGMMVDIGGVEAFLPGSQIDILPVRDTGSFLGKTFEFKILKISAERKNIVVSRRELLEERMREKKKKLLSEIQVGERRRGMVKNITDFGVFVDLNGMDGLLHITDMSWGRVGNPGDLVKTGEELEVVILAVDLEKERVSLGLKQKSENPWKNIDEKYPIGSRVRGKVVNLMPYGAFVELEEGVEGLVHVSELSWTKRIVRASDVLTVGDVVDVVVLNVNADEQKIALGIRQTAENPWDTARQRYPVGSRVSGAVRNFTSYGAFVELEDGIDGMIHVSDMSWTRKVNHPSEVLKKGDHVEAVVLEVDPEQRRISLGLKQAQDDPWVSIESKYRVGDLVKGKVSKLATYGAFVELGEGIDGLVHISQISEQHVEKVNDVLQVGQDVEARVVRVDPVERRIGLSIKAAQMPDEEFAAQKETYVVEGLRPGEAMVDLAGALDQAFGLARQGESEEWRPGEGKRKDEGAAAQSEAAEGEAAEGEERKEP